MASFTKQVVLITGAGSGIGRQLALTLAAEGAAIGAVDLQSNSLGSLGDQLGNKPHAEAVADVTDLGALKSAVAHVEQRLGPVDILIASAGIGIETSALNFHGEDFEKVIRVNLIGVANSFDAVLPGMISRRRGQLVALSSLASYRGLPKMAAYCASKSGVNALMDSMRVELRDHNIAVTAICPGSIRTPMTDKITGPMPDILEVEEAVRRMVKAIRARRAYAVFPRSTAFRVRLLRWLPTRWSDWLVRRMLEKLSKIS